MPNSNEHCGNCSFKRQAIPPAQDLTARFEHTIVMDRLFGHSTAELERSARKRGLEPQRICAARDCAQIIRTNRCLIFDRSGNERNINVVEVKEK